MTSPKQNKSFCEATHRFNIWVGAVRSGKTHASIERFIEDLKNGPPGDAMIIGVNRTSIQRNLLVHLYKRLGFPCPTEKSSKINLYGRNVWIVGAPDISAVSTIQGSTLALAYVDEATNIPEPFWKMLESRLSIKGAKLLATTNPESPSHWLKKEYIDNKNLDLITWHFNLDDNPSLDETFKQQLKNSYSGLWYRRYVEGLWSLATGAIFDGWDNDNIFTKDYPAPVEYVAALDYGTINPTACHIAAISPNAWPQIRIEKEYYFDSVKYGRSKTDRELARDIQEFLGYTPITALYVDPAAASLKLELRNMNLPVIDANNDVLFGVKTMSQYISGKNLLVRSDCTNLIEQIQGYAWCPKAANQGEDKPIKKNDHAVDSCRYLIASRFKHGLHSHPDENISHAQLMRKVFQDDDIYSSFNNQITGF